MNRTRTPALTWYEDMGPGSGGLEPRAWYAGSDAGRMPLNGKWLFRLSPGAATRDESFARPGFDASGWATVEVPGHWVLQGAGGAPAYTNVVYPFPVDPPRVPAANPTGNHLRTFDLPAGWAGDGDVVLRFDGVESCARVWLNGRELGAFKGSRLPHEFAVGGLLRAEGNVLAVRVHQWSSGSYLEDQDQWWLPGIFRDVTLLERPRGAPRDFFVHAGYDHRGGSGTLRVECEGAEGRVLVPELGVDVATGEAVTVAVEPWTAETPRLYDGELVTSGERIGLRVGFRSVVVEDAMQTPYVRPQENGARADLRWAKLTDGSGAGVRAEGGAPIWFTARRWTSEQLDAAEHRPGLRAGETVWVNLDHAVQGLGSQSCGPGVLPEYRLDARAAELSFVFTPLG
ncbi:sugar-binding domain-containing protein [Streptomyces sp. NPDC058240]|uniref:sugar-binding domain-containing protein n=1 Tax=Streptomyces sp. NPDC058240 TaxID=3346396 RepID=UPI0036ED412E